MSIHVNSKAGDDGFRPLTGISLFLLYTVIKDATKRALFSSPHGDFSFSMQRKNAGDSLSEFSSPHGDFSFSIVSAVTGMKFDAMQFSSPHGDFSFSMVLQGKEKPCFFAFSSPHGDFSFSIHSCTLSFSRRKCFRPLTGISLFLYAPSDAVVSLIWFSSPHGDFSFSIKQKNVKERLNMFSSPHGDFSFSMLRLCILTSKVSMFSSPHGDFSFSIDEKI